MTETEEIEEVVSRAKRAKKKQQTPMNFIVEALKRNPIRSYASIETAAAKRGLKIFPIMFGRAQLTLGLVKRGQGREKKAARVAKRTQQRTKRIYKKRRSSANRDSSVTLRISEESYESAMELTKRCHGLTLVYDGNGWCLTC